MRGPIEAALLKLLKRARRDGGADPRPVREDKQSQRDAILAALPEVMTDLLEFEGGADDASGS